MKRTLQLFYFTLLTFFIIGNASAATYSIDWNAYYDDRNILNEISDEPVDLSLDENLSRDILSGRRKRSVIVPTK